MSNRRAAVCCILILFVLVPTATVWAAGRQEADERTTVSFLTFENDLVYDVIDMFEADHPDIRINYELPGTEEAEVPAQIRMGMGDPTLDIVTTEVGFEYQWYWNGWITPLDDYVTDEELAAFMPGLIDPLTYQGHLLGMPFDNTNMYLAFNRDLLGDVGVEGPPGTRYNSIEEVAAGTWTWEEVTDVAQRVNEATGKIGIKIPETETWVLFPLGYQRGGRPLSEDGLEVRGYLDTEPWFDLARWYYDNGQTGVLDLAEPHWTSDTFVAGEAAFYLSHIGQADLGGARPDFEWDATTQPYFEGGVPKTQTSGCAWSVTSESRNKEAAMTFLKYITLDPDASWHLTSGGFFAAIPLLREGAERLYTEPEFEEFPLKNRKIGLYQSEHWRTEYPKSPVMVEYWEYFQEIFDDLRVGAREPEEAILTLTDRVDRALDRYR